MLQCLVLVGSRSQVWRVPNASTVTVDFWKAAFKGQAAKVLLETILVYLVKENIYARHANIVHSSGTGKSRMVDELGKTVITVPMCLRDPKSSGLIYNRSLSLHVRSTCLQDIRLPIKHCANGCLVWARISRRSRLAKLLHGFLASLLDVTLQRLKRWRLLKIVIPFIITPEIKT